MQASNSSGIHGIFTVHDMRNGKESYELWLTPHKTLASGIRVVLHFRPIHRYRCSGGGVGETTQAQDFPTRTSQTPSAIYPQVFISVGGICAHDPGTDSTPNLPLVGMGSTSVGP